MKDEGDKANGIMSPPNDLIIWGVLITASIISKSAIQYDSINRVTQSHVQTQNLPRDQHIYMMKVG